MANEYVDDGIPFLRSQDILPFRIVDDGSKFITPDFHAKLKKSELRAGDVAIVRTGFPGTAAVVPQRLDRSNCADLVIATPGPRLNPWFLACLMNSAWGKGTVSGVLVGVAQQHFNVGAAKEMQFRCPPIDVQDRIADILSAYNDLIENNTRRIAILEDMGRRLFEEWFIHRRAPFELAGTEDWIDAAIGDVFTLQRGFDLPTSERADGPYPVVAASGIHGYHREYKVLGPGVTTGRSGTIGQFQYIEGNFWPLNTSLWIKEFKHGGGIFAYYLLSSLDLSGSNTGAAVPSLNRNIVHVMPTTLPPLSVVSNFEAIVGDMRRNISGLADANINLRTTRDLLLPKLISGEIEVWSAEEALETAAA